MKGDLCDTEVGVFEDRRRSRGEPMGPVRGSGTGDTFFSSVVRSRRFSLPLRFFSLTCTGSLKILVLKAFYSGP